MPTTDTRPSPNTPETAVDRCAWCGETNCGKTFEQHRRGFTALLKLGCDRYYQQHPEEMPPNWRMG